jgi:hypothetical protein
LIIANFYFWTASTHHSQKSQRGLLRTILYQILRQCPDLIQVAYNDEWIAMTSGVNVSHESTDELLTVPALLDRLRKISTCTIADTKFCFFLDALDEYDGRPADIIELIDILSAFQNVKVCVSSRPWNEFEDHFGHQQSRKLYMQDLTRDDIRLYVKETLGSNALFKQLQSEDSQCPDFVQNIVDAADGVFLWVYLVVRSLLEGLTNSDRIKDLQQRLNETPKRLEDYFEAMLFSTENRYRPQTARILSVAITTATELPLMAYWVIDQDDQTKRQLLWRTERPEIPLLHSRNERMCRRLKVLGKGLLEVGPPPDYDDEDYTLWDQAVTFLHRTVKDYLQTPNARALLESWWQDQASIDWDIFRSLGILATMAPSSDFDGSSRVWHHSLDFFFLYARRLDANVTFRDETHKVLDHLQKVLEPAFLENLSSIHTWCSGNSRFLCNAGDTMIEPRLFILSACTCAGVYNYVSKKFKENPRSGAKVMDLVPTIYWCVVGDLIISGRRDHFEIQWDPSMLRLLLSSGADPDAVDDASRFRSEWMTILSFLEDNESLSTKFEAIKLLVKYGAKWDTAPSMFRLNRENHGITASIMLKRSLTADQFSVLEDIVNRRDRKDSPQLTKKMKSLKIWAKSKRSNVSGEGA